MALGGRAASAVFQATIRASRQLPRGEVVAQGIFFARYAAYLVQARRARYSPRASPILDAVRERGFTVVEGYWSRERCAEAVRELDALFEAHPSLAHRGDDERLFGVEHLGACARAFHDDPFLLQLADEYTGEKNRIDFTLANRVGRVPSRGLGSGGDWHRDGFTPELKTLLYLNDVSDDNGPFQLFERSHRAGAILRDMKTLGLELNQDRVHGAVERFPPADRSRLRRLTAPAGSLLVFDTRSIHTGAPLRAGLRYAYTNYIFRVGQLDEAGFRHYAPIAVGPGPKVLHKSP